MMNTFTIIKAFVRRTWIGLAVFIFSFCFGQLALAAAPVTYSSATQINLNSGRSVTISAGSVADQTVVNTSTLVVTISSSTGGSFTVTSLSDLTVTQTANGTITQSCSNTGPTATATLSQNSTSSSVFTITPTGTACSAGNSGGGGSNPAPTFVNFNPPLTGTVGSLYAYTVAVTYTEATNTITFSLGTVPSGMTIGTSSGAIQWTPTATGSFNVTINVSDSYGNTLTKSWLITVSSAPVASTSSGGGGGGGGGAGGGYVPPPSPVTQTSTVTPAPTITPSANPSSSLVVPSANPLQNQQNQLNSLLATLHNLQGQQAGRTGVPSAAGIVGSFVRNLAVGMTGADVMALQTFLIQHNSGPVARKLASHGVTKLFGPLTRNALAEFQKANGINPATGYFGTKTRAYINTSKK